MLLPLCLMLGACCATNGVVTDPRVETRIVDTACDWTAPIMVSKHDVLTEGTAQAILSHNRSGARVCGWQKKGPTSGPK